MLVRLEVHGPIRKLNSPDFWSNFIINGCKNIQELVIDDKFKVDKHIRLINEGLISFLKGPKKPEDIDTFDEHLLKKITFVRPLEDAAELMKMETLLM